MEGYTRARVEGRERILAEGCQCQSCALNKDMCYQSLSGRPPLPTTTSTTSTTSTTTTTQHCVTQSLHIPAPLPITTTTTTNSTEGGLGGAGGDEEHSGGSE